MDDPVCRCCWEPIKRTRDGWVHYSGSVWCTADPRDGSCALGPLPDIDPVEL